MIQFWGTSDQLLSFFCLTYKWNYVSFTQQQFDFSTHKIYKIQFYINQPEI